MPVQHDNITLRLDGTVPFPDFAIAMRELDELLKSLSLEITGSPTTIHWRIIELSASGAVTTVQGVAADPTDVPPIVTAFSMVGQALAAHAEMPYSENICRHATAIASLINGEITAVHFTTSHAEHIVRAPPRQPEEQLPANTFGAIEGRIRTLPNPQALQFTLYESLFGAPVICYASPRIDDDARRLRGQRVLVEGLVRRDPKTGIPTQIKDIRAIHEMPVVPPGSYRAARGALRIPVT